MDEINLDSLPAQLQSRILGKLNFMDDILTGKIEAPPAMTISTGPSPLQNLLNAVKSDMQRNDDNDDDNDDSKESKQNDLVKEVSSTLFSTEPPSKKPPKLFNDEYLKTLQSLNQNKTNPKKYPLTNDEILSLQNDGFVVIDDYIKDKELIKNVKNEIDSMNKNGKMKEAGLRRINNKENDNKNNIEIKECGTNEINGIYEMCKDLSSSPIRLLINKKYNILNDICYNKNDQFSIVKIQSTQKLSLFIDSNSCWIIFKYLQSMSFPIIYYVAPVNNNDDYHNLNKLNWICIGGILPFGKISKTNKWLSSSIRNDLHCWLHSDDKDIGKSLKKCIISMDEIRVQLNKLLKFNSNTTQVQATLYPGFGAKYVTHIDEPPNIKKKTAKRKLTCLMYFNLFDGDQYNMDKHGGCLRIYLGDNKYRDIQPFGGRMIVFNSQWLPHQVLPSHFNRYAVTLWMY